MTPDGDFGPSTLSKCPTISSTTTSENLVLIVQGGLYCKGYNPREFDGSYGPGVVVALSKMEADAGLPMPKRGVATPVILKALLTMDAFVNMGDPKIRTIQQYLNNQYFTYIAPKLGLIACDGIYSSRTIKALIYGLQYYRHADYDGILWDVTANPVDEKFIKFVNEKMPNFVMETLFDLDTNEAVDVPQAMNIKR